MRRWLHAVVWLFRHITRKYAEPEAERLGDWLAEDSLCVDIGAHAGSWSIALSRLVPRGRVVAFEGFPYYARILKRILPILGCRNVDVVDKVVAESEEPLELIWKTEQGERLTGLTHIRGSAEKTGDALVVASTTLDSFFARRDARVSFIKMDIEGAELQALRGGRNLVSHDRPIVYLELDAQHTSRYGYAPQDVFLFFAGLGYHGMVVDQGGALQPVDAEAYGGSAQRDVWFIPAEQEDAFVASGSRTPQ
jgi:FkbM family methyltransferase